MVTKATGKPRGRPAGERRDLREDPDGFALALGLAFQTLGAARLFPPVSERKSFLLALAALEARPKEPDVTIRAGENWLRRAYELPPKEATVRKNGKLEPPFKGRVSTLSKKAAFKGYTPDELGWLKNQIRSFCLLLSNADARLKFGTAAEETR
jgi:hypothetical protein